MKTKTIEIYQFDELSEQAKENAREWWRSGERDFAWSDEWMDSAKKGLEAFGAELKNWSIDCLNINASSWTVKNHNDSNADELTGVRLRTWLINNYWSNFFERKPYGKYAKNEKTGKWAYPRRSKVLFVETSCPFTGYCGDENFMDVFREFVKKPNNRNFQDLLEEATEATFRAMEQDCEFQQTDEYIDDILTINDYEFEEDGTKY